MRNSYRYGEVRICLVCSYIRRSLLTLRTTRGDGSVHDHPPNRTVNKLTSGMINSSSGTVCTTGYVLQACATGSQPGAQNVSIIPSLSLSSRLSLETTLKIQGRHFYVEFAPKS